MNKTIEKFFVKPCSYCGAKIGEPCRTKAGRVIEEPHLIHYPRLNPDGRSTYYSALYQRRKVR